MARTQRALPGLAKYQAKTPSKRPPPRQPEEEGEKKPGWTEQAGKVMEGVRDIAAQAPMHILAGREGSIEGILHTGQFLTQHETGTSGGSYTPSFRKKFEEKVFGPGSRPVYGYFSHGGVRDMLLPGEEDDSGRSDYVGHYGHTAFRLGEHMRPHTTFTYGDSLGASREFFGHQGEPPTARRPYMEDPQEFFTEMQVHTRPTLSDVSRATVYEVKEPRESPAIAEMKEQRSSRTQEMLKGAGIPHEVHAIGHGGQTVLPLSTEDWREAVWKQVGPEEPGKTGHRNWTNEKGKPMRVAFEPPRNEEKGMLTIKSRWKPEKG